MFLDQRNGFHAVFSLPDHIDLREALEQVRQFVPRRLLVVDDDGVNRHGYDVISFRGFVSRLSRRRRVAMSRAPLAHERGLAAATTSRLVLIFCNRRPRTPLLSAPVLLNYRPAR